MKNIHFKILILFVLSFNYLNANCIFLGQYQYLNVVSYEKTMFYMNKIEEKDTLNYVVGTLNVEKLEKSLNECPKEDVLNFKDEEGLNLLENLFLKNTLNKDILNMLLKNYTFDFNNDNFFKYFKLKNHDIDIEVLKILLDKQDKNINFTDKNGKSFLHLLVEKDDSTFIELEELINYGIDIKIKDKNNDTALNILHKKLKEIKKTTNDKTQIKKIENFIKIIKVDKEFRH